MDGNSTIAFNPLASSEKIFFHFFTTTGVGEKLIEEIDRLIGAVDLSEDRFCVMKFKN
jgi:hypothetical protein